MVSPCCAGGTHPLGGAQDIDALTAYFGDYKSPKPVYDPAVPALAIPRITLDGRQDRDRPNGPLR